MCRTARQQWIAGATMLLTSIAMALDPPAEAAEDRGRIINVVPDGVGKARGRGTGFEDALRSAKPGDTILLAPGTYDAPRITRGGSPGRPVTIRAANAAVAPGKASNDKGASLARRSILRRKTMRIEADHVSVEGIHFDTSTDHALIVSRARGIAVRHAFFDRHGFEGIGVLPGSGDVLIEGSVFRSDPAMKSPHAGTDYGVRIHDSSGIVVRRNVFDGLFNHALSLKKKVDRVLIEDNLFRGCGHVCIELGQTPDGLNGSDNTSGSATVRRNRFQGAYSGPKARGNAIYVRNIREARIENNSFSGFRNSLVRTTLVIRGGDTEKKKDRITNLGPGYPSWVLITGNDFGSGLLDLEGRGNAGDRITIEGNRGGVRCRVRPFDTARLPDNRFDWKRLSRQAPMVEVRASGLTCSR